MTNPSRSGERRIQTGSLGASGNHAHGSRDASSDCGPSAGDQNLGVRHLRPIAGGALRPGYEKFLKPVCAVIVLALSVVAWMLVLGIAMPVTVLAFSDVELALLGRINSSVNASVTYKPEPAGEDVWRIAVTEGDCEDFALRKRRDLIRAGYPEDRLKLLLVPGHAMLLARTSMGAFVLDNRTDDIVLWDGFGRQYRLKGNMWVWSRSGPRAGEYSGSE